MEQKQNLLNQIYQLESEIKSLSVQINRLMTVYNGLRDLYSEVEKYRNRVRDHNSSINPYLTVCLWEGQSVKDFKQKYIAADSILFDDIILQYNIIIEDLENKINELRKRAERKQAQRDNARKKLYILTNP